ncbi:Vmc-like lipoprotein signal peptide domain-containing protein [Ureaplasma diversum]|uniref:Uncharacterized protein n=1 Tax=Ureaplasma diversum NCTC 246 TaxID=1188241 RepID=A0A084EWN5_9BACT|nr:hypothetical protein [Ureaplasma diversum]KEZ22377.1 Hypothetical protein, predicted lipoprotein [Ureaplasma diversum NCTC 246]
MKYKSKQKWLFTSLVTLSAISIAAVAVSCTPKNSNPTKPSKPAETKKNNPQNSLSKPSDNKISTPSKPKPTNPLSSQPKNNPSDTKKDSVDKVTKPSDPTNNQKDKDQTGNSKTDKDQKNQQPKTPETNKENKTDSLKQGDNLGSQKNDLDSSKKKEEGKQNQQNQNDNNGANSDTTPDPKQPSQPQPPEENTPGDDPNVGEQKEPAPKKDELEKQDEQPQKDGKNQDPNMEKPKGMEADKPKPQQPALSTPDQEGKNQYGKGQDGKGQDGNPMSEPEVIDDKKPLLELKETSENISLNPGSNEGRLTFKLSQQNFPQDLKDKFISIVLMPTNGTEAIESRFQKIEDIQNIEVSFVPIIEFAQYKLVSAKIYSFEENSDPRKQNQKVPKELTDVVFRKVDKNKSLVAKKQNKKNKIQDTEQNKTPVKIIFDITNNKLELTLKPKDNKPINNKYLKFSVVGLEKERKIYTTPRYDSEENLLVTNNKAEIKGVDFENDYKNVYDHIIVKIYGIYDDKQGNTKSSEYRFDYDDPNSVIDFNNNLILSKDINKG